MFSPVGALLACLFFRIASTSALGISRDQYPVASTDQSSGSLLDGGDQSNARRVQVDLGVMSRCPDARLCEAVFDDVLKTPGIPDKVNLTLNYIATVDEHEKPYGMVCKHGALECAGNIHQLCVQSHVPSLLTRYSFLTTQNYLAPSRIGELDYAKRCAAAVRIDWEGSGVAKCVQGREGTRLLKESAERTKEMGVSKSCTILIEGRVRCIHDGSWYDCDEGHEVGDFVRSIEREWEKLQRGLE